MNEALIYRNKKMFSLSIVINIIILIGLVAAHKPVEFITTVCLTLAASTIINYFLIYRLKVNPILSALCFIGIFYWIVWLIIVMDPSLNKFLFVFAGITVPTIYQDKKISTGSFIMVITVTIASYVKYKQEIFGGYDVVEPKSLIFTLVIICCMTVIMMTQASASENLRKEAEEQEKEARLQREKAEEMLKLVEENAQGMKNFNNQLNGHTKEVRGLTSEIVNFSNEMELSFGEQTSKIANISENVKAIGKETKGMAENSEAIMKKSAASKELIRKSEHDLDELTSSFSELKHVFDKTLVSSREMTEKTEEISKLSTFIEEIANKTNMLALNAAIEAARAGEHGKGFSVVAQEVRNLADTSFKATSGINKLLEEIKTKSAQNQEFILYSQSAVETSKESTSKFNDTFHEIKKTIDEISGVSVQIGNLSTLISEVDNLITDTTVISDKNAAGLLELNKNLRDINSNIEKIAVAFETINH